MSPTRITIDTDPGVDNALTILLALASPEIQLEALTTTHGNIGIEKTTRNVLAVLEFANASHIPVARGFEQIRNQTNKKSGLSHPDFLFTSPQPIPRRRRGWRWVE